MKLAVIIPTKNEAERLPGLLSTLKGQVDVIVADCGSEDATVSMALEAQATVVTEGCCCRAGAMNAGAEMAKSRGASWLWFLHADSRLPDQWWDELELMIKDAELVGGAFHFDFHWDDSTKDFENRLKWVRRINRFRYRMSGVYFGDQGIFL